MDAAIPIAVLGLSTAGKTALIRSAINNQSEIFPTAGIQINYITTTSKIILAYDCSGQGNSRQNWHLIGSLVDSIIYVIDAHNTETFSTAKKYLVDFLEKNKYMRRKNLCIMLNKCDLKHRPPKQLLVKGLQAQKWSKLVSKYYIKESSAYNKEGIDQSLEWIIKNSVHGNQQI